MAAFEPDASTRVEAYKTKCKAEGLKPNTGFVRILENEIREELDLNKCLLGGKGFRVALEAVAGLVDVSHVNVSGSFLEDADMLAVISALYDYPNLTSLDISHNPITDAVVPDLADLAECAGLTHLDTAKTFLSDTEQAALLQITEDNDIPPTEDTRSVVTTHTKRSTAYPRRQELYKTGLAMLLHASTPPRDGSIY